MLSLGLRCLGGDGNEIRNGRGCVLDLLGGGGGIKG